MIYLLILKSFILNSFEMWQKFSFEKNILF